MFFWFNQSRSFFRNSPGVFPPIMLLIYRKLQICALRRNCLATQHVFLWLSFLSLNAKNPIFENIKQKNAFIRVFFTSLCTQMIGQTSFQSFSLLSLSVNFFLLLFLKRARILSSFTRVHTSKIPLKQRISSSAVQKY